MLVDMGNRSGTSSKRRRRLLLAACIALIIAITTWLCWPRIDPRFVGTWTDGEHPMVIGSDGYADSFFVQWRDDQAAPIRLYRHPNGDLREIMAVSAVQGRIRFRTSGNRFQVAVPHYQTDTVMGLLKYFLAVLKGERTEEIFCDGTIVSISDDSMTLEFEFKGGAKVIASGPGVVRPRDASKGSMKLRRVKQEAS
ncbi:hypothetical protein AYO47_09815 [Planctomyces sp. SCGC AG-212-M04]|nr:hypothetical protein AYO47_09815 [Planctomyces sp. SCGC AG-212-M04]